MPQKSFLRQNLQKNRLTKFKPYVIIGTLLRNKQRVSAPHRTIIELIRFWRKCIMFLLMHSLERIFRIRFYFYIFGGDNHRRKKSNNERYDS